MAEGRCCGVGFTSRATARDIAAAVQEAVGRAGGGVPDLVATLDRKVGRLAAALARCPWDPLPQVAGFTADELRATPAPRPSSRVAAAVGTPSVAEAAALRGAASLGGGAGAAAVALTVPKLARAGVTAAVAAVLSITPEEGEPGAVRG